MNQEKHIKILFVHPEAPQVEEKLPPTFEVLNDLIQYRFPLLPLNVIVMHGNKEVTVITYPLLFQATEYLIELDFKIPLPMYTAEMNTSTRCFDYTEVSLPIPLLFRSRWGFDTRFLKIIQDEFSVFGGKEKVEGYTPYYLDNVHQPVHYPFKEAPIYCNRKPAIVFVKPHKYSFFCLKELSQVALFHPFGHDVRRVLWYYTDSKPDVKPLYQTNEAILQQYSNLDGVVDHCVTSLKMIQSCVHYVSKATRRLVIDVFVTAVASLARLSIDAEKEFSSDWNEDPPHGTGPLDYYMEYEGSSVEHHVSKKQRTTVDSSSTANVVTQMISTVAPIYAVIHTTEDQTANYDEGEDVTNPFLEEVKAIDLTEERDVDKGVAQLLTQMLETLKRKKSKRTIASWVSNSSIVEGEIIVKGILSTGEQYLFFILREQGNSLPVLHFLGRYTVRIFPFRRGLKSVEKDIDPNDVKRLLKNLLYFLAHMD